MRLLLIGIKGTGMSHLASFLKEGGDEVLGLDVENDFFTQNILSGIQIFPLVSHLPGGIDKVIYSTAYEKRGLAALEEARKANIPTITYPEALKELSETRITAGISGTHGKTTTSSIAAYLLERDNVDGGSVFGSYLKGRTGVFHRGDSSLVIEACEYQDHFLLYDLEVLAITNIDFDHPDFFADIDAVRASFRRRFLSMKRGGIVIAHSSTESLVRAWMEERRDITVLFYGKGADIDYEERADGDYFLSERIDTAEKGRAIIEDYVCSLLVASSIELLSSNKRADEASILDNARHLVPLVSGYPGVAARGEKVREQAGILYLDEYAHHPREIAVSLENLRAKYPSRRLVVLFMPHTSSRTEALMDDFASSLSKADLLFLQSVYGSARHDEGRRDSSRALIEEIQKRVGSERYMYIPGREECVHAVATSLKRGDVCITMGAGDNRALIDRIIELKETI